MSKRICNMAINCIVECDHKIEHVYTSECIESPCDEIHDARCIKVKEPEAQMMICDHANICDHKCFLAEPRIVPFADECFYCPWVCDDVLSILYIPPISVAAPQPDIGELMQAIAEFDDVRTSHLHCVYAQADNFTAFRAAAVFRSDRQVGRTFLGDTPEEALNQLLDFLEQVTCPRCGQPMPEDTPCSS